MFSEIAKSRIVMLALGAYILYLLYRPESSQYYEVQSAPRI